MESHALSLYAQVNSRKSQENSKTDCFENVRVDFFRGNVAVILEELATRRAKSIGLFAVPRDVFGRGSREHSAFEVRVKKGKRETKR